MPLCIVIPARNEATRLGAGLAVLAESLRAQGLTDAQVIVSDNGSTDETRSVAEAHAALFVRPIIYLRAAEIGDRTSTQIFTTNCSGCRGWLSFKMQ